MASFIRILADPGRRRTLTWSGFVLLGLIAAWVIVNAGNLRELRDLSGRRQDEEQKLRVAQKGVADLEERIERLKASDFEAEKRIRGRLMLKPGEEAFFIEPEPEDDPDDRPHSEEAQGGE